MKCPPPPPQKFYVVYRNYTGYQMKAKHIDLIYILMKIKHYNACQIKGIYS